MQHMLRSQAELLLSQKNKIITRPVDVSLAIGTGERMLASRAKGKP